MCEVKPGFIKYVINENGIKVLYLIILRALYGCIQLALLWYNLYLLFWLSLVPFTTDWINENHLNHIPVALYGFVLFMIDVSLFLLSKQIIKLNEGNTYITKHFNKNRQRKSMALLFIYTIGFSFVFFNVYLAMGCFFVVGISKLIALKKASFIILLTALSSLLIKRYGKH